jgi:peroxiredoxin
MSYPAGMPLQYGVGDKFPSIQLKDDRDQNVSIEALSGGMPLILAFFRGPW